MTIIHIDEELNLEKTHFKTMEEFQLYLIMREKDQSVDYSLSEAHKKSMTALPKQMQIQIITLLSKNSRILLKKSKCIGCELEYSPKKMPMKFLIITAT